MNETIAQGFFLHFDDDAECCHVGAAVIMADDVMAVAGFNGIMPSAVGQKLVQAASKAGVKVTVVRCDGPEKVVALTWGKLDPLELWETIARGMAVSATKAFVVEAMDAGLFPRDFNLAQLDDLAQ